MTPTATINTNARNKFNMTLTVTEAQKHFNVAKSNEQKDAFLNAHPDSIVLMYNGFEWLGFMAPHKPHTHENVLKLLVTLTKVSYPTATIQSLDIDKEQFVMKIGKRERLAVVHYYPIEDPIAVSIAHSTAAFRLNGIISSTRIDSTV